MPKQAFVVMISSTGVDLPDYREALRAVCNSLHMVPQLMEDLPSGPGALEKSLAMVDEADIYLGLFAHRYGSIPVGQTKSFTELEFDRAQERDIEILNFFISDDHPVLPNDVDKGDGAEKLSALKAQIQATGRIINRFTTVESLKDRARLSLSEAKVRLLAKNNSKSALLNTAPEHLTATITTEFDPRNPFFNVPFRPKGAGVIGRSGFLERTFSTLHGEVLSPFGHIVALVGLGGLGKTQLAVEYATQYSDEYPGGVFWFGADEDIDAQLTILSDQAKWVSPLSDHKTKLDVALNRIRSQSDCLIIFDNVEEFQRIRPYLPHVIATPHLLLTTQREIPGVPSILLDFLDPTDSRSLLIREAGAAPSAEDEEVVAEILERLDGLPLALEMAGVFIARLNYDWKAYLALLKELPRRTLKESSLGSFTNHDPDVFATLRVSERVLAEDPLLQTAIDVLTWSGTADMGICLLSFVSEAEESELTLSLMTAVNVRLIRKHPALHRYSLHRLLQLARRENADMAHFQEWQGQAARRLGEWFEHRRENFADLTTFESEFDHLVAWHRRIDSVSRELSARLLWLQAYPPYHRGRYQQSHDLIVTAEKTLHLSGGDDRALDANIFNDLGFTYSALGKHDKALELEQKALGIRLALLGEDHPDTASAYGNLGATYSALGKHDKALELEQKALDIRLALLGEDHPDTATAYGRLGYTYCALGKHGKALEMARKAHSLHKGSLGVSHDTTRNDAINLAIVLNNDRQMEHAKVMLREAIQGLPEDHSLFKRAKRVWKSVERKLRSRGQRFTKPKQQRRKKRK